MADYLAPFNLKTLFINTFLGSTELFIFAFIIIFSSVCAKFNMSNKIFLILLGISSIILAGFLGQPIFVLMIFIIGIVIFKGISRITQGG